MQSEEKVHIPYKKILRSIVVTLLFQLVVSAGTAYYLDQSSPNQLFDIASVIGIIVFIAGTFMMGQSPNSQEVFTDPMHADRRPPHMREMSISSRARGTVFMASSILFVLLCVTVNWSVGAL
jgi:hypothetical protein